jgi:hypothetical protein
MVFFGLVTSLAFTVVGLIVGVVGAVGWCFDVFPHPKHEAVELLPKEKRPVITSTRRSVQHLKPGERGHRVRIPVEIHPFSAGIAGGLVGGVTMAALAILYGILAQGSIWFPINLLAAAGVPELAAAGLDTLRAFSLWGFIVACMIHFGMSIMIGLLYVVLLPMLPPRFEWFWGGIMTPLMWTAVVWASVGLVDPALEKYIDWPWFIACQIAFGMVGGYVVFKSARVETMQTWPLAAKLGIESQDEFDGKK